jgi:hypothetical protein
VSGGAVASLADAAQASQASQYLTDLAVWAGQKLSVLELIDPEAFEGESCRPCPMWGYDEGPPGCLVCCWMR